MSTLTAATLADALRSLSNMASDFPTELHRAHPDVKAAREALAAYDAQTAAVDTRDQLQNPECGFTEHDLKPQPASAPQPQHWSADSPLYKDDVVSEQDARECFKGECPAPYCECSAGECKQAHKGYQRTSSGVKKGVPR